MSAKDLIAVYDQLVESEDTVASSKATYRESIASRSVATQKGARITKALQGIVAAAFGEESKAYAEFGFAPRKTTDKSAETKALAVEKLRATRAARHTMGSRQKAAVHGDVSDASNATTPPPAPVVQPVAVTPPPLAPIAASPVVTTTQSPNGVNPL
jgi:hypothetical protein